MTQTDTTKRPGRRRPPPVVLITGPTSGIGAAVLDRLVRHPSRPELVLLARDPARLEAAVGRARTSGLASHGVLVDLSDLVSVRAAIGQVSELVGQRHVRSLDAVILNAGVQVTDRRRRSAQGFELTFAVNVLAQHALLRGLQSVMSAAGHAVLMGSSTHRGRRASFGLVPDPVWQPPELLSQPDGATSPTGRSRVPGGVAYATSKLAMVTLSHAWAARLGADGRRVNVYDPGLVAGTGLGRDMRPYEYWAWRRIMPAMSVLPGATTAAGTARHLVSLALGETHPDLCDGYVERRRVVRAAEVTFDPERRQALWNWCEKAMDEVEPTGADLGPGAS